MRIILLIMLIFATFAICACESEEEPELAKRFMEFRVLPVSGILDKVDNIIVVGCGWMDSVKSFDCFDIVDSENKLVGMLRLIHLAPHYSIHRISELYGKRDGLRIKLQVADLIMSYDKLLQIGSVSKYIEMIRNVKIQCIKDNRGVSVVDDKYLNCTEKFFDNPAFGRRMIISTKGHNFAFVLVEPGSVRLGTPPGAFEPDLLQTNDRLPWQLYNPKAQCTYSYWIMETEFSAKDYKSFLESRGREYEGEMIIPENDKEEFYTCKDEETLSRLAAGKVSYSDALGVAEWLSSGLSSNLACSFQLRIPTLLEHKHAAHGNSKHKWYWGDNTNDAPKYEAMSIRGGAYRKRGKSNCIGAYDMYGNMFEWVFDRFFAKNYYPLVDGSVNPIGDIHESIGSYVFGASLTNNSVRCPAWLGGFSMGQEVISKNSPYIHLLGFRLVLSPLHLAK